jgi:hypothetical protein
MDRYRAEIEAAEQAREYERQEGLARDVDARAQRARAQSVVGRDRSFYPAAPRTRAQSQRHRLRRTSAASCARNSGAFSRSAAMKFGVLAGGSEE